MERSAAIEESMQPREDRFGLFDPRFAPRDANGDSDSDGSPGKLPAAKAPLPEVDLLDMDADADPRPKPSLSSGAGGSVGTSTTPAPEDWADFCTPTTAVPSASLVQTHEVPAAGVGAACGLDFQDFSNSVPTPSASSSMPPTGRESGPDPFEGMEFNSAGDGGFHSSQTGFAPGVQHSSGYGEISSPVVTSGQPTVMAPFFEGMGVNVNMFNLDTTSAHQDAIATKPQAKGADSLQALDFLHMNLQS